MLIDLQSCELQLKLFSEIQSDRAILAKVKVLMIHCYTKYFG